MRTEEIRSRLSAYIEQELLCLVGTTDCPSWLNYPIPGDMRFGWMPPLTVTDETGEEHLLVLFAPDLMAQVTADLNDHDFENYLTLVEFVLAKYVELGDQPKSDVTRLIEDTLYREVPEVLKMRYEIEARALGTIVPS